MPRGNPDIKKYGFKKGKDPRRNITGPKAGIRIPDLLRRFGEWQCPDQLLDKMAALFPRAKRDKLTVAEAVYLRVYVEALQGESWAVQFIADRTDGKVTDKVEVNDITAEARAALAGVTDTELFDACRSHPKKQR